ncbi:MAG: PadR family transcriptional regulator [Clostridiales bacterium]|nr:PadR family transcriptional regulator [Clostridiales bacterium]
MKISKELTRGSNALLVLGVISKCDMYGYQIVKTIETASNDVFIMKEGTLYPILHQLEKDGCLESYWCEAEGRNRKYYKITEKGLKQLVRKQEEWQVFSAAVGKVLGGAGLVRA